MSIAIMKDVEKRATIEPYYPYKVHELNYQDVRWEVFAGSPDPTPQTSLQVRTPAKCFKCGLELRESRAFLRRGYMWKCVGCGFSKRNQAKFAEEVDRVEKIAQAEIDREYNKKH
jgi:hypothetical protein